MNFDDDLPIFMADFGVAAITPGMAASKQVIFNKPDTVIFDGMQTSNDFTIRYLTSDFPVMHDKTAITVNGTDYKIKGEPLLITDGKFSLASLHK